MNRTERAEVGLRPALSRNETTAGQLARTFIELDRRELNAMRVEMAQPAGAIRVRAEDAQEIARVKLCIDAFNEMRDRPVDYSDCASYWAALS